MENETTATMTAEEYAAEIAKLRKENEKLMKAQSDAASDVSKLKKDLAARMTEREKEEAERKAELDRIMADYASLKKEKTVSQNKSGFLGCGFDSALADKAASIFGEYEVPKDFFAHIGEFVAAHDKARDAATIMNTPSPVGGGNTATTPTITKQQFAQMGYMEMLKLKNDNPELYDELMKN